MIKGPTHLGATWGVEHRLFGLHGHHAHATRARLTTWVLHCFASGWKRQKNVVVTVPSTVSWLAIAIVFRCVPIFGMTPLPWDSWGARTLVNIVDSHIAVASRANAAFLFGRAAHEEHLLARCCDAPRSANQKALGAQERAHTPRARARRRSNWLRRAQRRPWVWRRCRLRRDLHAPCAMRPPRRLFSRCAGAWWERAALVFRVLSHAVLSGA